MQANVQVPVVIMTAEGWLLISKEGHVSLANLINVKFDFIQFIKISISTPLQL